MFKNLKELGRNKIGEKWLGVGDSLQVTWKDERGEQILVTTTLAEEHMMCIDEAIIFEGEYEDRRALGGMVLEKKPV